MSALLFNAVTFDPLTSLYTYNYIVQNDSNSNIGDVAILVGNTVLGTYSGLQPLVPDYTAPSNWTMFGSFSGSIASAPYNESGGFYEWYGGYGADAIQPGAIGVGFSVTSRFAPTLDNGLNDYFLYGPPGGIVGYGNVVVPSGADWMPPHPSSVAAVPEPSTWLMLLIGFVALSAAGRRLTVQPAPAS